MRYPLASESHAIVAPVVYGCTGTFLGSLRHAHAESIVACEASVRRSSILRRVGDRRWGFAMPRDPMPLDGWYRRATAWALGPDRGKVRQDAIMSMAATDCC